MTEKEIKKLVIKKLNKRGTDRDVAVACFNYLVKFNKETDGEIISFKDSKHPDLYFLVDKWTV